MSKTQAPINPALALNAIQAPTDIVMRAPSAPPPKPPTVAAPPSVSMDPSGPLSVGILDGDPTPVQDTPKGAGRAHPRESTQMSVNVSSAPLEPVMSNEDFLDTTPPPPPAIAAPLSGDPGVFAGVLSFESSQVERHGAEARIEGLRQTISDLPDTAEGFRDCGLDIATAAGAMAAACNCSVLEVLEHFAALLSNIICVGDDLKVFAALADFCTLLNLARTSTAPSKVKFTFGVESELPPPLPVSVSKSHHKTAAPSVPPAAKAPAKPPAPPKGQTEAARALAAANAQAEKERIAREKAAEKDRLAKVKELKGRVKVLEAVPGTEVLVSKLLKEIDGLEKVKGKPK